ncbi:50S ribosomal protein L21 [Candidatus Absconditicoccus praedator]|uniref:50S ribosomal protein L21 n=1 Tax=Candidatus Absconditicoccus praedator TaxID=2735562 RepID=UPI001E344D2F|nr:50S ribosomal protein L21 [Candidatus Absconditicoccus praedator]UFX82858.1 50S ribosomal protein L21 [Candidatus Absconditicoccus praedator]
MYAVVDINSHQYIVKKGDQIEVDKLKNEEGEGVEFENVLACFDDEGKDVKLGKPYVDSAKISAKVVKTYKDKKINVVKFHNKNRYHRKYGFRPQKTLLQIEDIKA